MRSCGECSKSIRKYGQPIRNGYFIDQIVVCTHCGWVGVETDILDKLEPVQISFVDKIDEVNNDNTHGSEN